MGGIESQENQESQVCPIELDSEQVILDELGISIDQQEKVIKGQDGTSLKFDKNGGEIEINFSFLESFPSQLELIITQGSVEKIYVVGDGNQILDGLKLSSDISVDTLYEKIGTLRKQRFEKIAECKEKIELEKAIQDFINSGIGKDLPSIIGRTYSEIIKIPEETEGSFTYPGLNFTILKENEKPIAREKYIGFGDLKWTQVLRVIAKNIDSIGNIVPFEK